jgi:rubrerythrin
MEQQVLLDKLSEFLTVEQGGLQLYEVAASHAVEPELQRRYQQFAQQTAQHRAVLVTLIKRLGGDPNYVSPTARLAQVKAEKLLSACLIVEGLSLQEIEANDLENLLLAETKDHADWEVLSQLAQQATDPQVKRALAEAVQEVEPQEDEHLTWARQTLSALTLRLVQEGPAPLPERWQRAIIAPEPPITAIHPAPMEDGLLGPARQAQWEETPIARSLARR